MTIKEAVLKKLKKDKKLFKWVYDMVKCSKEKYCEGCEEDAKEIID